MLALKFLIVSGGEDWYGAACTACLIRFPFDLGRGALQINVLSAADVFAADL